MTDDPKITILIIGDDAHFRKGTPVYLKDCGYDVIEAEDGRSGLEIFRTEAPDLILLDLCARDAAQVDVLAAVAQESPDTPLIVVSSTGADEDVAEALRLGAWDYVLKSVGDQEILKYAIRKALERSRLLAENKRYQERLEKTALKDEQYYRSLLTHIHEDILVIGPDYRITDFLKASSPISNSGHENIIGRHCFEVFHGYKEPCYEHGETCLLREVFNTGEPRRHCHTHRHTDWTFKKKDILLSPLRDGKGNVIQVIKTIRDVTSLSKTGEALRDSEERFRQLAENIDEVFWMYDVRSSRTLYVSPACSRILKRPVEALYENPAIWTEFIHEDDVDKVKRSWEKLLKGNPVQVEFEIVRPDGSMRLIENHSYPVEDEEGKVVRVVGVAEDVTDKKNSLQHIMKIQAQLQRAQKMEALGTLAGGIAHDFNNILTTIIGFVEIMTLFDVPEDSPIHGPLQEVLKAADRAKELVQQILTFSRQAEQVKKPLRLSSLTKEALKFLRASLPATIEISHNIENETGIILAESTQIHQVMMNLCANAAHAMKEKGGVLKVELAQREIRVEDTGFLSDLNPGQYLNLTVSDTGHGMNQEIMDRIFDPFFTTKNPGEGTGMGLSMVHGIVTRLGGAITVESQLGEGSVFRLYFPSLENQFVEVQTEEFLPLPTGKERILFVDDERQIVQLAEDILGRLGYDTTGETSSTAALNIFQSHPDQFDMVITDLTMPDLTGIELAYELQQIRSNLPIILCSGYGKSETFDGVNATGIDDFIEKPLTTRHLAEP